MQCDQRTQIYKNISNREVTVVGKSKNGENGRCQYVGAGLHYVYNANPGQLQIFRKKNDRILIKVDIVLKPHQTAEQYLRILDKTLQVQAAIASDNKTIDITDVFHVKRIKGYLLQAIEDAAMTLFLKLEQFTTFEEYFCALYDFDALNIRRSVDWSDDLAYYKIALKTLKGNIVEHSAEGLHTCLMQLSRHIVSDLIMRETRNNFEQSAHRLLRASTKLSILSYILNDDFDPASRIGEKNKNFFSDDENKMA